MKEEELEEILFSLGKEFKEKIAPSLIPSTLKILENRGRKISFWLKGAPVFLTLLLSLGLIKFFSFADEPFLNLVKVVLFVFSSVIGGFSFLPRRK